MCNSQYLHTHIWWPWFSSLTRHSSIITFYLPKYALKSDHWIFATLMDIISTVYSSSIFLLQFRHHTVTFQRLWARKRKRKRQKQKEICCLFFMVCFAFYAARAYEDEFVRDFSSAIRHVIQFAFIVCYVDWWMWNERISIYWCIWIICVDFWILYSPEFALSHSFGF